MLVAGIILLMCPLRKFAALDSVVCLWHTRTNICVVIALLATTFWCAVVVAVAVVVVAVVAVVVAVAVVLSRQA